MVFNMAAKPKRAKTAAKVTETGLTTEEQIALLKSKKKK